MRYKLILFIGVTGIVLSIFGIVYGYTIGSYIFVLFAILLLLVSIFFIFLGITFDMFTRDKQLDIQSLTDAGLTIVICDNCGKDNVLEDQFCIFCGEQLDG